jgi:hypothetical protein
MIFEIDKDSPIVYELLLEKVIPQFWDVLELQSFA